MRVEIIKSPTPADWLNVRNAARESAGAVAQPAGGRTADFWRQ